jgi:hypothetical protein
MEMKLAFFLSALIRFPNLMPILMRNLCNYAKADQRVEMSWMLGSSLMWKFNWKTHKLANHSEYLLGFINV